MRIPLRQKKKKKFEFLDLPQFEFDLAHDAENEMLQVGIVDLH